MAGNRVFVESHVIILLRKRWISLLGVFPRLFVLWLGAVELTDVFLQKQNPLSQFFVVMV